MNETLTLTPDEVCTLMARESARLCREHYDMDAGDGWYYGGSSHNDDRLKVELGEDGSICVADGNARDTYTGPMTPDAVTEYVADWLSQTWGE